jgi:poly-beta-1,6-N-acetyl-D-glucosamine synthase
LDRSDREKLAAVQLPTVPSQNASDRAPLSARSESTDFIRHGRRMPFEGNASVSATLPISPHQRQIRPDFKVQGRGPDVTQTGRPTPHARSNPTLLHSRFAGPTLQPLRSPRTAHQPNPHLSPPAQRTRTSRREQPAAAWPRVAVVIAAHNEEAAIGQTLAAAVGQKYPVDTVLVMADNCTDRTTAVSSAIPGVTVVETRDNVHRKSGALNAAWRLLRGRVNFIACIDADTILPPDSISQWIDQMLTEPQTAGISARFTMQPEPGNSHRQNVWARLQKAEFARWTDTALNRGGHTTVLAGTACMLRMSALEELHEERTRAGIFSGPWSYASQVEDFELTYRLRSLGHVTKVSYKVRAYTEPMVDMRSLWAQRMKWQCGTVEDLLQFGVNRLTLRDWGQQVLGLCAALVRIGWLASTLLYALLGTLQISPIWFLPPLLFIANDIKHSLRVPHRDWKDVFLAAVLLPQEAFAWMRAGWFSQAWVACLFSKVTGRRKDRWKLQYAAEAK